VRPWITIAARQSHFRDEAAGTLNGFGAAKQASRHIHNGHIFDKPSQIKVDLFGIEIMLQASLD